MSYLVLKWLHILSSTLLFGTGLGSAFYMFFASRTRDPRVIAQVVRLVVIADWAFTTPSIIAQPVTGLWMVRMTGYPLSTPWLAASMGLYLLAGAAWLPVVWMQMRMRDLAARAAAQGAALPPAYDRMLKAWVLLGIVAFVALVIVFWLMVIKPSWT
jgi:uncharacterized membrane protein